MSDVPADAELTLAAQAGDPASLGLLLERHRADMQAVALSLLGYSPEMHDAVQDAMLVALQRIGELRDPAAAGAWLRAIVRNACRMRLRAARATIEYDSAILTIPSYEPSHEEMLDRQALRDWVWHALESLSEPLQQVTLLRYFSGVSSYDQIAAICGVPVGTVRSRLHQARQKLSESLLATAGSAHDDAAVLTGQRRHEASNLLASAECGEFEAALEDSWSSDLALVGPDGERHRGYEFLLRAMQEDYEAGVRQRLANITASRRMTIMECDLVSPPWDPDHCPPGVVWLLSLSDDRVTAARLFHPHPARVGIR